MQEFLTSLKPFYSTNDSILNDLPKARRIMTSLEETLLKPEVQDLISEQI